MAQRVEKWITDCLAELLGSDSTEELAKYILSIGDAQGIEEYLTDLLDIENPRHRKFIQELSAKVGLTAQSSEKFTVYKKPGTPASQNQHHKNKQNKVEQKSAVQTKNPSKQVVSSQTAPVKFQDKLVNGNAPSHSKNKQGSEGKKKSKYVPLFSAEGEARTVAKLPGRHVCDCLATKHGLINNCLQCGRIVCEQEGAGPCLFCGTLVCSREDQEILAQGTRKSEKLRQKLMNKGSSELSYHDSQRQEKGLIHALQHKEKLLEYDRTSVKRTQVIDDESDYFTTEGNTWLNPAQRGKLQQREEELRSQRHGSRLDRKITLDLAGRQVLEDDQNVHVYDVDDDIVQEVHYGKSSASDKRLQDNQVSDILLPGMTQLKFQTSKKSSGRTVTKGDSSGDGSGVRPRLQDAQLQQLRDEGMCLSMHQPWATLLIKGIKRHEGRTWYCQHRGRLWIAAAGKQPSRQEIEQVEQQYRLFYGDPNLSLPTDYPTGCLLGCVDLVDCLAQEEYREQLPGGESESPYVFICENPQELVIKFPMKGQHKIYKLDSKLHQGAKKGLHYSHQ